MLVLAKNALNARQAESYYQEKYSEDDYYSESRQIRGEWFGKGAVELGLADTVTPEEFKAILAGHDPSTGRVLVPGNTRDGAHRAGWDATFNAPKSISLQALVGGDEQLLEAHHHAVRTALGELEAYVQSRVEGGSHNEQTGNLVAAQFTHIAARPSRSGREQGLGPDPHLHTHVVIANMTQRGDGQWRAVDPRDLYRSQAFATAVYRASLAQQVQKLGYEISPRGERGEWELAGYTREQLDTFSHRRQDIEQQLIEQGRSSAAAAQIAAHQTRLPKGHETEAEMRTEWQKRTMELGLDLDASMREARLREGRAEDPAEIQSAAWIAVRYAREHLTERDAVMHVRTLEMTALQRGMGHVGIADIRQEIARQVKDDLFIAVTRGPWKGQAYTTHEMLRLENENLALWQRSQNSTAPLVTANDVQAWAQEKGLSAEQTTALTQTLESRDWLNAIEGLAGSAKTTTVGAMRELLEKRGRSVYGFGPTTGSVNTLQEAGTSARTVAALLALPVEPQPGAIWVVDETSLLATRTVNALLHKAQEAGVERVIFVGDQRQHEAIESGRPIAQLQEAGMATARLSTIRRQRDPDLRAAVQAAAQGKMKEAVEKLDEQGRVTEIVHAEARYYAIAQAYLKGVAVAEPTLVISPANAERTELNATIRATLQREGYVAFGGMEHGIFVGRSLTKAEVGWAKNYQVGNIIQYRNGSRKMGIEKGGNARVVEVEAARNALTVRTEEGREVRYSPAKLKGVDVYREEKRRLAEGDRIQFRAPLKKHGIANGTVAEIASINKDETSALLRLNDLRTFMLRIEELRHIDYGYAVTSHSAQGITVDKVLVNVDTERSAALVNQRQFYVSLSRARQDAQIYTNSREELGAAVSRTQTKSMAREAVEQKVEAPQMGRKR